MTCHLNLFVFSYKEMLQLFFLRNGFCQQKNSLMVTDNPLDEFPEKIMIDCLTDPLAGMNICRNQNLLLSDYRKIQLFHACPYRFILSCQF